MTTKEIRRLAGMSGVILLVLAGLTVLCDTVDKSSIVTYPAGALAPIGLIVSGILYIKNETSVKCVAAAVIPIAALLGASIGLFVIGFY